MNIFGRYVSVAVLWSFVVSAAVLVYGAVTTISHGWTADLSSDITLVAGALGTFGSGLVHTWDTMPSNTATATTTTTTTTVVKPTVAPPPAPPALA